MSAIELAADVDSTFDLVPKAWGLAEKIARTEFVPGALRGKPDAIMACVLAGAEMGIQPMKALQQIHVIDGRPSMSAELMRAVVQAHGHEIWIEEATNTRVTVCGRRSNSEHSQKVTWTLDDADKAGLKGKQNWRKYPRQMLLARASAELVRMMAPDVLAGLSYATEEVQDGFDFDTEPAEAEVVGVEPEVNVRSLSAAKAPAKKRAAKKKATAKKVATKRAEPAADLPPLPGDDDVVDAEIVDEQPEAVSEEDTRRAQQIAMRARDLDVDHHDVVYAATAGRATSAKGLSDADHDAVREALRQIKVGAKVLDTDGAEPTLVDPPPPEPEAGDGPDEGDVDSWDGDMWRDYLQARGLKVVATLREAQRIAAEADLESPGSLADLQGTSLAVLVLGWVEDQAGDR